MNAQQLQTMELLLKEAAFRNKRGYPMPTTDDARKALRELGVNSAARVAKPQERWVETSEELDALPEGAVIRDAEERVLERWDAGWLMTGQEEYVCDDIDLPALVLYTPKEPQT